MSTCLRRIHKLGYDFGKVGENDRHVYGCHTYPYVAVFQAKKKPHLTPLQKKKRLAWAMAHRDWEQSRWDKVIFYSDESTFELAVHGDTRMRVIRSEAFHPACLARTGKFPAKLMVWGCIGRSGPGQLHFVQGILNAARYQDVLEGALLPSVPMLRSARWCYVPHRH